ncbi:glutamate-5-semialdehyde dehydrogenase [Terribacillus sp. DMT04]|uniref:glutamate-5-semialdehyde dehydrogenase n=1 Tax=Terribacillus sp. DMT04 TaxID=2850441 RepID=UPI001C2C9D92|nr:glutamate-5-semialdehyde dehydrogenase [Terribacillus sp. DMT04]QXE01647.1 glutamate-5-semialdehyde dehydrogenase [Terribacillus sp. DMT04]
MEHTLKGLTVEEQAISAKAAGKQLALLTTDERNEALLAVADQLAKDYEVILAANDKDMQAGEAKGFDAAFLDRLKLTRNRIEDFANGLKEVVDLDDPTGKVTSEWTLENGLQVSRITVPLGVIGMIYEARPNVTADATGLALKSGNSIVLKGGSSAIHTNKAIVEVIKRALEQTKVPAEAVQLIQSTNRKETAKLFTMKEHIDVLIPRGGASLIQAVVDSATVPVLETGVGNCHMYIDRSAEVEMALATFLNAKTDRPAVCNALETLIVHRDWLQAHKAEFVKALQDNGIQTHGDESAVQLLPDCKPATEEDWSNEYLSLDVAVKVVDSVEEAIKHIDQYGTKHSEAIISEDDEAVKVFMKTVDAAALYHNASTRFTDGHALGFGAEIGISTQKLHARGPMGLPALTTYKYVMTGNGQTR